MLAVSSFRMLVTVDPFDAIMNLRHTALLSSHPTEKLLIFRGSKLDVPDATLSQNMQDKTSTPTGSLWDMAISAEQERGRD